MVVKKIRTGFTILEFIIVLAIIGVVISMAFSFFSFGNKMFTKGEDQSNAQHSVRVTSMYITNEIRTSKDVMLLETKPTTFGDYNYIYFENNKIFHKKINEAPKEILNYSGVSSITMEFNRVDSDRAVEFDIYMEAKDQKFEINSKVIPLNITSPDIVLADVPNSIYQAIRYSNPITDPEAIVRLDALLLDLKELNSFLDIEGTTMVLDVPTKRPNRINLPTKGQNGSEISWNTDSDYLVTSGSNIGTVYRPNWNQSDETLKLTATLYSANEEKSAQITKDFIIKIKKLEPLGVSAESLIVSANEGVEVYHEIKVLGGNPGYNFIPESLPFGLTIESNGILRGFISREVYETIYGPNLPTVLTADININDNHMDTDGNLNPNPMKIAVQINITWTN